MLAPVKQNEEGSAIAIGRRRSQGSRAWGGRKRAYDCHIRTKRLSWRTYVRSHRRQALVAESSIYRLPVRPCSSPDRINSAMLPAPSPFSSSLPSSPAHLSCATRLPLALRSGRDEQWPMLTTPSVPFSSALSSPQCTCLAKSILGTRLQRLLSCRLSGTVTTQAFIYFRLYGGDDYKRNTFMVSRVFACVFHA